MELDNCYFLPLLFNVLFTFSSFSPEVKRRKTSTSLDLRKHCRRNSSNFFYGRNSLGNTFRHASRLVPLLFYLSSTSCIFCSDNASHSYIKFTMFFVFRVSFVSSLSVAETLCGSRKLFSFPFAFLFFHSYRRENGFADKSKGFILFLMLCLFLSFFSCVCVCLTHDKFCYPGWSLFFFFFYKIPSLTFSLFFSVVELSFVLYT